MAIYTFHDRITDETADRVMPVAEYDAFVAANPHLKRVLRAPQIMRDIPEYASPIDGKLITSRSHRREDLERNNCREWEPSDSATGGKFRNERFAKKVGATVAEEFRDLPMNQAFRAGEPEATGKAAP